MGTETEDQLRKRFKHGRQTLLQKRGFGCCYVVGPSHEGPVKIGYASDLVTRVSALQGGSWLKLWIFECMWFVGPLIAARVEAGALLTLRQAGLHMRGEWFDTTAERAAQALKGSAADLGMQWIDEAERRRRAEQMFVQHEKKLFGMFAK